MTGPEATALNIHITGVVQGVGFRPFVYNLATELRLVGWVLNSSSGVEIEVVGPPAALKAFSERLESDAPPLARIEDVTAKSIAETSVELPKPDGFAIRHSEAQPGEFQPVSPDVAVCDDCLDELFDPGDRRYRYPFINCTNCGPRFTIIRDIPYDRPKTTMAPFKMCQDCQAEYDDPTDRRFHAQPNACPVCGPRVTLRIPGPGDNPAIVLQEDDAVRATRQALLVGKVVAIKGLGGFHLACDATNDESVRMLRERKGRVDKPFALMTFDLEAIREFCNVNDDESALLTSRERPIVLLEKRATSSISPAVAPGSDTLGVMLPYTPLHYLLLEPADGFPAALVMTSGNYSEEPIATGNDEALERLGALADAFLLNDREIHARCDDSVTRIVARKELPIRRSRGYAPYPVHLPFPVPQILAVGAELKNTFCLTRDRYAFLSQHIGDMENYETLTFFQEMVEQLKRTFRIEPKIIAHDLHPGYLSTRYAEEQSAEYDSRFAIQHHHAQVASCMAEHGLAGERPVIGVAFDGTGYGTDGAIWGGEFLIMDYASFRRTAHLKYVPLPGGDAAIRRPYRIALAHLWAAGAAWDEALPPVQATSDEERVVLLRQLERRVNTVSTSSSGRLFDAVSALAGVRQEINYEAQAAIELEALVEDGVEQAYRFDYVDDTSPALAIDPAPVLRAVVTDVKAGAPRGTIAAKFHNSVARMIQDVCVRVQEEGGLHEVVLSGGVFQNVALLERTVPLLAEAGFSVYTHHLVPPNDGGLSLGQAVIAAVKSRL
ncbi:MAG: carbamoyltransferase HypF [Anaerolineae bacterium]|jgi:hydrogenase maturation protein HypF